MRIKFSEYYKLKESEIKNHWDNDIFSFDANVLLNIYRYTPKTRDAFFKTLESINNRLWISYQAAHEYQKNRLTVISAQKEAYKEIGDTLEAKKREIENKLNTFKKHPYLQTNDLKNQINSAFQSIIKDLNIFENKHPDLLLEDPIFEKLTELLNGKVGDDFNEQDLEKLYRDAKKRYEEKIPPGYMDIRDKKNEGNRSLYGDVIVWKQLIEFSAKSKKSIIFITDDLKEDWWHKFKGKTIGARPELLKEFKNQTGFIINIYQADRFLELANINLKQNNNQSVIDEVRNVRLADEQDLKKDSFNNDNNDSQKSSFEFAIENHLESSMEKRDE